MPNIATLLKQEITRLSRREIRKDIAGLKKASASYRREIAALKRQVADLERKASQLAKNAARPAVEPAASADRPVRFVAKGLKALRKRLGLSASGLALLLGVSEQAVFTWETKRATPRKETVAAIVALRGIGKREAQQRLEAAKARQRPARKAKKRRG